MPTTGPGLPLFLASALLLAVLPGPGIFYVATRTLAGGRAEGLSSSLGTGIGGLVHVAAGAVGVSALVLASATLFAWLKVAGAAYLIWLGARTIRTARRDACAMADALGAAASSGARRAFLDGVLIEALNPKTAGFFLAFLPQFVDAARGGVAVQFMALGLVSVAFNTAADVGVTFAAGAVRAAMARKPALVRRVRQASGGAMILLGAGVLLVRRPAPA